MKDVFYFKNLYYSNKTTTRLAGVKEENLIVSVHKRKNPYKLEHCSCFYIRKKERCLFKILPLHYPH